MQVFFTIRQVFDSRDFRKRDQAKKRKKIHFLNFYDEAKLAFCQKFASKLLFHRKNFISNFISKIQNFLLAIFFQRSLKIFS